jgi:hypothetical protein
MSIMANEETHVVMALTPVLPNANDAAAMCGESFRIYQGGFEAACTCGSVASYPQGFEESYAAAHSTENGASN